MKSRNFCGFEVSRLGIGTVQFGLPYGIANKTGQVDYDEVCSILESSVEKGITLLDTSRFYGTSEEILGKAIKELGAEKHFVISTKLDLEKGFEQRQEEELVREAEDSLMKSLEALGIDSVPFYLLHTERYLSLPGILEFVVEQKSKGLVKHIGVSVEKGPEGAFECLRHSEVEVLQIAFNAVDGRWRKQGFFNALKDRRMLVMNRSSYLQGLLLMDEKDLPDNLHNAGKYLKKLGGFSKESGIPLKELCLRYVFSSDSIDCTIIGVDSLLQFNENIAVYEKGSLPGDLAESIAESFLNVPEHLVNPSMWGRKWR